MVWPVHAALLGGEPLTLLGRRCPLLTARRLGELEALGAPCAVGGAETRWSLGAALAVLRGGWARRAVLRGGPRLAALAAWIHAPRLRDAARCAAALHAWIDRQLWSPDKFEAAGKAARKGAEEFAAPVAARLCDCAVRLGFGSPLRSPPRGVPSAWDAPLALVCMMHVARDERGGGNWLSRDVADRMGG
jgi:hypothetical protein